MNIISHNLPAMNANRQLKITNSRFQKTSEQLASGFRINRAADDAAGLSISEKMRAQIRGLNRGADNLQDGISYVQVADGALEEVQSILQRINELSVQAANGTNSVSDREALDSEVQSLKLEMERIFVSTKFNDKQIWSEDSIANAPTQIGTTPVQAMKITTPSSQSINVTNETYNKIAKDYYTINADTQGIHLTWEDFDGHDHTTLKISWDELEKNNYSFQVADYFDPTEQYSLFDANDNPLFDFEISFAPEDCATIDNMIDSLNGTTMRSNTYAYGRVRFENADGSPATPDHISADTFLSLNANYMYDSHVNSSDGYDYDLGTDVFAKPDTSLTGTGNMISQFRITTVSAAEQSSDTWSFAFNIEGVGDVVATSSKVYYYSSDETEDSKDIWWKYRKDSNGNYVRDDKGNLIKDTIFRYPTTGGAGSLASIMDCLTGANDPNSSTDTPGLLTYVGKDKPGGTIGLEFTLTTGTGSNTKKVGDFTLSITVDGDEQDPQVILNRINNIFDSNTILDIYTTDTGSKGSNSVSRSYKNNINADKPVYENHFTFNDVNINIHSGPTADDHMTISYQSLRVEALGLHNTSVLTQDDATKAINEVDIALNIVNKQRSKFGAYQNRMEHSLAANQNTAENTAAAESRIRDTDMAEAMLGYSKDNILTQSAQAILAQANQEAQGVITLLRQ